MSLKGKCFMGLIGLGIVDVVIPLPILTLILIYVLFQRPPWFLEVVRQVYGPSP